jgi:hypothetical protein
MTETQHLQRRIPGSKVVCSTTDHAANMISEKVGVSSTLVRNSLGAVIGLFFFCYFVFNILEGCISHGSALAAGDTHSHKKLAVFRNTKLTIGRARVFLNHSTRKQILWQQQALLDMPPKELTDLSKTRFLNLGEAAETLRQQLPAVLPAMRIAIASITDKTKKAVATALYSKLASPSFLICLSIESVAIGVVNISNRFFQGKFLNFSSYRLKLKQTLLELQLQKTNNGPEQLLRKELRGRLGDCYTLTDKDWVTMKSRTVLFIDVLCDRLVKRIPELKIVCDFDVFDPTAITTVHGYGVKRIKRLFEHFLNRRQPHNNAQMAARQWAVFRDDFPRYHKQHPEIADTMGVMNALLTDSVFESLPILRDLCDIALTLSFSTAIVESTFSVFRIIKNYRTNGLSSEMLSDLLTICMNGPAECPVDKSEEIACQWLDCVARRFTTDDKSQKPWAAEDDLLLFSGLAARAHNKHRRPLQSFPLLSPAFSSSSSSSSSSMSSSSSSSMSSSSFSAEEIDEEDDDDEQEEEEDDQGWQKDEEEEEEEDDEEENEAGAVSNVAEDEEQNVMEIEGKEGSEEEDDEKGDDEDDEEEDDDEEDGE